MFVPPPAPLLLTALCRVDGRGDSFKLSSVIGCKNGCRGPSPPPFIRKLLPTIVCLALSYYPWLTNNIGGDGSLHDCERDQAVICSLYYWFFPCLLCSSRWCWLLFLLLSYISCGRYFFCVSFCACVSVVIWFRCHFLYLIVVRGLPYNRVDNIAILTASFLRKALRIFLSGK